MDHRDPLEPPTLVTPANDVELGDRREISESAVATATEPSPAYRGRRSRHDYYGNQAEQADEQPGAHERFLGTEARGSTKKPRRTSPGPSTVSSILRRMTTIKTPLSRSTFRSTKRSGGGQYASLEDGEAEQVPVDLSTLEGLGFELQDMTSPSSRRLQDQETEYVRPSERNEKPDFQTFVSRSKLLGDGMKDVGAQLRRNSTRRSGPGPSRNPSNAENGSIERTKTVRDIGQSLAQEKNVIVAVSEGIDLSSLEGHRIDHRASQTFDDMTIRSATVVEETQSYFFPQDPDVPNWRPFSMRSTYILVLAFLAFFLAGFQEYLCQISDRKAKHHTGILAFNRVSEISVWDFFAWKYLPTMVTIIYAVLFSIMDFDVRRLEPYYQLSQPLGSRAAASLNLDHLTMFQYFVPFKAFRLKQWAVFVSTTGNIIASLAAPALQNPSLVFVTNPDLKCNDQGCPNSNETQYWVRVHPVWSRVLSVSYLCIAIITVILFIQLRRKSGLLSDPKGIAGIASMATKSHILQDFSGLDQATRSEIHNRLQHRRFILYKSSIWQGEFNLTNEPIQESERRLRSPHPLMLRLEAAVPFLLFMVFGLVSVPLISLTRANVVPNAAPWLPVLLATLLKLFFTTFESDVRLMEPFYQLSRGNALPQNSLTLDYQATVYGWMPFKAMLNRHWLVALVGFSSVALDVLTVTIGSFSVNAEMFLKRRNNELDVSNQDETFVSFWVSLILSIIILVFVIFTTSLVYFRRRHPFLPREPSTIAAVLAFIYASNMLTDFISTERLTNKEMEAKLKQLGKRYGLGWFRGRDGQIHCAIDEEPMKSRYVHGKPYTMAQAGPLAAHESFYYAA